MMKALESTYVLCSEGPRFAPIQHRVYDDYVYTINVVVLIALNERDLADTNRQREQS